jgi:hypothetical protein
MPLFVPASTLRSWRAARATATSVGESASRYSLWTNSSCRFQISIRAAVLPSHDPSFTLWLHCNVPRCGPL